MALALMYDLPDMNRPRYAAVMREVKFDRK